MDGTGKSAWKGQDMKPLNIRLQNIRRESGIPWDILERDYLLSWILAGISQVDILNQTLVFKGGTALKKCYFGDYRFSEDLDFSTIGDAPTGDAMEQAMQAVCIAACRQLDEYAPVEILCQRYLEKQPHPGGQEAFSIRARLPWQRQPQTRVIVEISIDEKVLRPVEKRKIIHEYGEPLNADVTVYSLEEIVAEKLRAIHNMSNDWKNAAGVVHVRAIITTYGAFLEHIIINSIYPGFECCWTRNVPFEMSLLRPAKISFNTQ